MNHIVSNGIPSEKFKELSGPGCSGLLVKNYDAELNESTGVVKLTKVISSGEIDGKDKDGQYKSGKMDAVRYVTLSQAAPVMKPKGKSLFDEWTQEDYAQVDKGYEDSFSQYNKDLEKDYSRLAGATQDIERQDGANQAAFQQKKSAQEEKDSLVKDLVIAYITGGMGGIKAALKNKVEDAINTNLATAWMRATGADPDLVSQFSDAMSILRGRLQAQKIKARSNTMSVNSPIRSIENIYSKTWNAVGQIPVVGPMMNLFSAQTMLLGKAVPPLLTKFATWQASVLPTVGFAELRLFATLFFCSFCIDILLQSLQRVKGCLLDCQFHEQGWTRKKESRDRIY